MATWTTAYINDLPDSAFLYIEPGGKKDEDGRTTPRSLRHFPYKDSEGNIDLPHLRNAIARIPQADIPEGKKKQLQERARAILAKQEKSVGDDALIAFGDEIKALDGGRIGGYLVRFSSANDPDLTGDYFDRSTAFGPHKTSVVYYQHGFDGVLKARVLDDDATLTMQDAGVWIEAQLDLRDEYERQLYGAVTAGKMGWSSGTASHLVEREPVGKAYHIKSWPLGLDASITPTPAEPRTSVVPLKAYLKSLSEATGAEAQAEPEGAAVEAAPANAVEADGAKTVHAEPRQSEVTTMSDETKTVPVDVEAIAAKAAEAAIEGIWKKLAAEKPEAVGGFETVDQAIAGQEGTKNFGDFLLAVRRKDVKYLHKEFKSTMIEGEGTLGGFLVPAGFRADLLKLMGEQAIVRPRASVIPAGGIPKNQIPALVQTGGPTAAGDPVWFGGLHMHWTEEGGTKSETNPEFEMIDVAVHEISGYTQVSNALSKDSSAAGLSVVALLQMLFASAFAWQEDYVFLRGNGVAKPLGILNSPALISVARDTANDIKYVDVVKMFASFMGERGVWLVSRGTPVEKLAQMEDSEGHLVWQPNAAAPMQNTLLGYPVIVTEKTPAINTPGDIGLYDFSKYLIYDMAEFAIDFSEHYAFINNKGTWRCSERIDGRAWLKSYITLTDGSTTVSPFVTLAAG